MADQKRDDAPQDAPAKAETPQERVQRVMADDAAEAADKRLDETVEGGHYVTADGRDVDANGEPFKGKK